MAGRGEVSIRVPGDKSVSQRALILAALAGGQSRIQNILFGADPMATGRALQALGVHISGLDRQAGEVIVKGSGLRSWRPSASPLDLRNSGTGVRLLAGALASQPFNSVLTGDASLSRRPMDRIATPLRQMGAGVAYLERAGRLPMQIRGGPLDPIRYDGPVASAQVKSAIILAGIGAGVATEVRQPRRSRDHTERMLEAMGVDVEEEAGGDSWVVRVLAPPSALAPLDIDVPADFSSAAFFLALAALRDGPGLTVQSVGLNETRTGFLNVLGRMGADVRIESTRVRGGEALGDVTVTGGGGAAACGRPKSERPRSGAARRSAGLGGPGCPGGRHDAHYWRRRVTRKGVGSLGRAGRQPSSDRRRRAGAFGRA